LKEIELAKKSAFNDRGSIRNYSFRQAMILAGPLALILIVFYLYPLIRLFPDSLIVEGQISLERYKHFFEEPVYSLILFRTLKISIYVTVLCFLIGYPVAYFLAGLKNKRTHNLCMLCILLPFFTSILVRSYAWIVLFQRKGVINSFLQSIGLADEPLRILYTEFAVLNGMVHVLLPFMILPIYSLLKNFDRSLLRAARNLGANSIKAFILITFPLSLPGVAAGAIFTFILGLGFYITPALLGGPNTLMMATLIGQTVNVAFNLEFAGVIAVILLLTTLIFVAIFEKIIGLDKVYKAD
jgi:mannopine transport system permease protein